MSDRHDYYADALLSIVTAEGSVNDIQDELFRLSRAIDGNDELRQALSDPHIPVDRRMQVVTDLLEGKEANPVTVGFVSMVVATGRVKDLPTIVDRFLQLTATRTNKAVAEVRAAVELSDDQRQRLAAALSAKVGREVEVVAVVDPTVVGGVVAQIGDTVIDGSLRSRLAQLRESF